ncbi:MAG: C25 family cysteine peptidase [Desulfosalsimonadaceae bacterium]
METSHSPTIFRRFLRLSLAVLLGFSFGLPHSVQAATDPRPQQGGIKIELSQKGVYRITGSDISATGIDPAAIDPDTFRLFHGDAEIRITVSVSSIGDEKFGQADAIRFYAPGIDTRYTGTDVYWLYWGTADSGRRTLTVDGTPAGDTPLISVSGETLKVEENHTLWSDTPNAPEADYWFWEKLTAPQTKSLSFDIPSLAGTNDDAVLSVYFQGRSEGSGGHHTVITLSGRVIGDENWPGAIAHAQRISVTQADLKSVSNQLTIAYDVSGSAGSVIYLNRVEIDYQKTLTARNNALIFTIRETEPARVSLTGFGNNAITVLDITDPVNVSFLSGIGIQADNTVFKAVFQHPGGERTYAAFFAGAVKTPDRISFKNPGDLKNPGAGADYILISDASFLPALEKLCELRRRQGMRVKTAATEDIYDAFSFGFFDPAAVRDFLKYAAENWQGPAPQYVLLAGDSNLDYRDYFGTGKQNRVPVYLSNTQELGLTPSDNWFVSFDEESPVPVMNIGRIPGADLQDVTAIVNKLIRYETSEDDFPGQVLLVADDDDTAFEDLNDILASYLPIDITPIKIYARLYPDLDTVTSDILTVIDSGALITSFVGHGDVIRWGAEPSGGGDFIIEPTDLENLANKDRLTCIIALNCLNGYFSQSFDYCLAEEWIMAKDKGAVACIAPSGLSHSQEHELFGTAVFENLFQKKENRIGDICTQSKRDAYYAGASDKVLISLNLIGDPATRLAIYRNPSDQVTANWITATAGAGGSISPSGEVPAFDGNTETFTITPADGYVVADVSVDGASQGAVTTYTFNAIDKDHAISATFKSKSGGGGGGGGGCFIGAIE